MSERNGPRLGGRILLALLTFYALAMIAPDFARLARPLGSFGLATNADGLIYDVQSPFATKEESPAWRAGLRVGDHLDLAAMRCIPVDTEVCASNLALWGGVTYVMPGREATLLVKPPDGGPGRDVRVVAEPRPRTLALDAVLLLTQIAGVLVVLGAAYLVWIRPGPMTWGFFAYTIQFNPGQSFLFYAWLQQWPRALLAQDVASCVLQAAGYTGLLLFALRAPVDRAEGRVAAGRARAAGAGDPVPRGGARQPGQRLRLPDRVRHASLDPARLRGQLRRARHSARPAQGSVAARLSTAPLGDLGLPDRPAGLPHCGNPRWRPPCRRPCSASAR